MRTTARSVLIGSMTVLVVAAGGSAAQAREGYDFSGSYVVEADQAGSELQQAGDRCPATVNLGAPAGRATALASAQKAANRIAGRSAMNAFAHSKAYKDPAAIPAGLMTALATGRQSAALALSLRGAQLEPKQPRHLINAAVMLIGFGDLKDANGLLAAATKLSGSGTALGVSERADLNAAKAELDVATGHPSLAEQIYRAVVGQAPGLLAASDGLAQAEQCQHKAGAIARWARGQRDMFDYVADGDAGGDNLPPEIDPGFVSEASGKDIANFGNYYHPVDQDDATAHFAATDKAYNDASARFLAIDQAITAENPTDPRDRNYLGFAALVVGQDAQMKALLAEDGQIEQDLRNDMALIGESQPPCYFSRQHAALWQIVQREYANHAKQASRLHILYTAMAADINDPVTNNILNQTADEDVGVMYSTVLGMADLISRAEANENRSDTCKANSGMAGDGSGADTPEDATPQTDPCSALKVERIKIKLGATASAEFSCEGGKVEVIPAKWGVDQAYIGAFGEAGVKWKSGDITGVAGVKVAISTAGAPGLPEVGASGKAGVYVTAGTKPPGTIAPYGETRTNWEVKDWGIRLQATAEVPGSKAGAVSTITKFDDKIDISLVGVFN